MTRYFVSLVFGLLTPIFSLIFFGPIWSPVFSLPIGGFTAGFMCKGGRVKGAGMGISTGFIFSLIYSISVYFSYYNVRGDPIGFGLLGMLGGIIGGWIGGTEKNESKQYTGSENSITSQYQQETNDYRTYMQTMYQPPGGVNSTTPRNPVIINPPLSSKGVKPRPIKRELMCHACRGRQDITFECPNCKNYYCSDCAPDLNNRCMECNIGLNRIISSTQAIRTTGRYDCYVCKNGFDGGFKCPKCGKNYCQKCGTEAEENCLNCSSMLERLT